MGLFDTFRKEGIPTARIYVNDCDEDTCLATWLLMHHDQVTNYAAPPINRLVYCEDRLDTTAGAYPFGDITDMRQKMAWVFEPYNIARFEERLADISAEGMRTIMEAVMGRISEHVMNGGQKLPLEGQYQRMGGEEGWLMVHETGPASRMARYNDGVSAFTAWLGPQGEGHRYVLGRKSEWVRFDIPHLYDELNKLEGDIITPTNRWGGSNTIGGSPRFTGSRFNPEELEERIKEILRKKF